MGDKKFTLFELHTHGDTQLGPRSIPGDDDTEPEPTRADRDSPVTENDGGSPLKALLALGAVLAVLAVGAKAVARIVGGGDGEFPPAIELDEEAAEPSAE